jgi:guanylate kinase
MKESKNNVFIISAPSGSGKSTLIQLLITQIPRLFFSISHTTRPPRIGEKEGVEYFFIDESRFQELIRQNAFLEWAEVHGFHYGTSREMMQRAAEQGKDLLLDVDIQGAEKVRSLLPEATTIFIMPPSYEVLKERLVRRQKDTPEQIQQRLENARNEIEFYANYQYVVVNEDLGSAFENLASIIRSERCRREILTIRIKEILKSFESH